MKQLAAKEIADAASDQFSFMSLSGCFQLQNQQSSQRCVELQAYSVSETALGITCSTAHFERLIQGHKLRWQRCFLVLR